MYFNSSLNGFRGSLFFGSFRSSVASSDGYFLVKKKATHRGFLFKGALRGNGINVCTFLGVISSSYKNNGILRIAHPKLHLGRCKRVFHSWVDCSFIWPFIWPIFWLMSQAGSTHVFDLFQNQGPWPQPTRDMLFIGTSTCSHCKEKEQRISDIQPDIPALRIVLRCSDEKGWNWLFLLTCGSLPVISIAVGTSCLVLWQCHGEELWALKTRLPPYFHHT